jgi:hypothetical protein
MPFGRCYICEGRTKFDTVATAFAVKLAGRVYETLDVVDVENIHRSSKARSSDSMLVIIVRIFASLLIAKY